MTTDKPLLPDESSEPGPDARPVSDEPVEVVLPLSIPSPSPVATFQGNNYDLSAVVAVTIGALILVTCMTCNFAYYLMPCLPLILGVFGLLTAKNAVDPERTKQLSWLSVGTGAVILLLLMVLILAYAGLIVWAISTSGSSDFSF